MRDRSHFTGPVLCALLVIFTVGVFMPALKFQFVSWDDRDLVVENPLLAQPTMPHLRQFWTAPYAGLFTPLSYMLWWTLVRVTGGVHAGAFHGLNIALHAGCAMLVFAILRTLLQMQPQRREDAETAAEKTNPFLFSAAVSASSAAQAQRAVALGPARRHPADLAAFAGAMLFALHPLQVEAVAWVSGMNNLLAGLLSLAAIWFYLRLPASHGWAKSLWLAAATVVFVLALLAKPTAVVVPLIILLLIPKRPSLRAPLIPWLCIATAFAILAHVGQPAPPTPLSHRAPIALDAISFYLWKLIWPVHLSIDYARTPAALWRGNIWIANALATLLIAAILWLARRRAAGLALGFAILIAALLPMLGLVPFDFQRYSTVADRYIYLTMLGPALAVAWLAARSSALAVIALLCVALLGWCTELQLRYWRDTASLVDHTLALDPQSTIGNKIRATDLAREGNFAAALPYYRAAMVRNPDDGDLHFNYANALRALGDYRQAMAEYETAIPRLGGDLRLRAINNLDITRRQLDAAGVPSR